MVPMHPAPSAGGGAEAALSVREALSKSEPLAKLFQRLDESAARFRAVRECFPEGLEAHVRAGPVDAREWTLLAANGAVAAKLRQIRPLIEEALNEQGWPALKLRIKVQANAEPIIAARPGI